MEATTSSTVLPRVKSEHNQRLLSWLYSLDTFTKEATSFDNSECHNMGAENHHQLIQANNSKQLVPSSGAGFRKSRSRHWPSTSCDYPRLPPLLRYRAERRAIGVGLDAGRNLMGIFQGDETPRTRYELLVERGRPSKSWPAYPPSDQHLPAGLSLFEICERYPLHVWGTGLRLFMAENITGEEIWYALPTDARNDGANSRKWNYLQQAMGREADRMADEAGQPRRVPVKRKNAESEVQESCGYFDNICLNYKHNHVAEKGETELMPVLRSSLGPTQPNPPDQEVTLFQSQNPFNPKRSSSRSAQEAALYLSEHRPLSPSHSLPSSLTDLDQPVNHTTSSFDSIVNFESNMAGQCDMPWSYLGTTSDPRNAPCYPSNSSWNYLSNTPVPQMPYQADQPLSVPVHTGFAQWSNSGKSVMEPFVITDDEDMTDDMPETKKRQRITGRGRHNINVRRTPARSPAGFITQPPSKPTNPTLPRKLEFFFPDKPHPDALELPLPRGMLLLDVLESHPNALERVLVAGLFLSNKTRGKEEPANADEEETKVDVLTACAILGKFRCIDDNMVVDKHQHVAEWWHRCISRAQRADLKALKKDARKKGHRPRTSRRKEIRREADADAPPITDEEIQKLRERQERFIHGHQGWQMTYTDADIARLRAQFAAEAAYGSAAWKMSRERIASIASGRF